MLKEFFFKNNKRVLFTLWLAVSFLLWLSSTPFVAIGVFVSGLTTLVVYLLQKPLRVYFDKIKIGTGAKFILLGSLGALWVETEFWIIHALTGAQIVANTNLLADYAVTMPWYVAMVALFWLVVSRRSYGAFGVFVLGGVYSFFAEAVRALAFGEISLELFFVILLFAAPHALSYSAMLLAPYLLLRDELPKVEKGGILFALIPVLGLLVYVPVFLLASLG
ncbi:MAG: hypothetical protein NUV67_00860 [archaeon]|nr:hypothetical protein [archaeon]